MLQIYVYLQKLIYVYNFAPNLIISVIMGSLEMWKYSHANYPLLEPGSFIRMEGVFVRDVMLTSFWQKHIYLALSRYMSNSNITLTLTVNRVIVIYSKMY